jgi:hypothetical protein
VLLALLNQRLEAGVAVRLTPDQGLELLAPLSPKAANTTLRRGLGHWRLGPKPATTMRSGRIKGDPGSNGLELDGTRSLSLPTPRFGPAAQVAEWLTVDEFAAEARLDRKTVCAAIRAKSLPGVLRLGNKILRICRTALLAFLAGQPGGSLKGKE